jgi:HEPN domain-containing protein
MPRDKLLPGSPEDWLRHAHSDLALAREKTSPKVLFEDLCFHAQQSVEKALKAVLIAQETPFPRTHNIRTLLDLLPKTIELPDDLQGAGKLTTYAVSSRYPGVVEPIDEEEHQESVHLAEAVVNWAEKIIKSS